MALVYKVYTHIQSGSDNTAPFSHNHPYISSCKLQLAEISTTATYVGMVMWEWCCVITAKPFMCILCRPVSSLHSVYEIIFIYTCKYIYTVAKITCL